MAKASRRAHVGIVPRETRAYNFPAEVVMRELMFLFGLSLLPIAVCAQAKTDSVPIQVRHLTLVGASQIPPAEQQQIAAEIENLNPPTMTSATSVAEIGERLRYALQERGYFKALIWDSNVRIVSSSPSEEVIDAMYDVVLGRQYRLKEIIFANNSDPKKGIAFGAGELRQSFPIKDGEIFNTGKIRIGLEKLRELYANYGYINFTPVPNTYAADERQDSIVLEIDLDEGAVFRVGALALDGVEPVPGAGVKLLEAWKQYEGQIYNPQVLNNYMRDNAAYFPEKTAILRFRMRENPEHHLVNIILELDGPDATN